MVNLGGHGAGMEYPGIVFDDMHDAGKDLFWITTHEVGHSWFPMIVGSDERRDAWMDEGFNTFIDVYQSDDFNHGEYGPSAIRNTPRVAAIRWMKSCRVLADPAGPHRSSRPADTDQREIPSCRSAISSRRWGWCCCASSILGPDRFDPAFRKYIGASWAFKHPSPSDFFRLMASDAAGEDLSWWWRGWYLQNTPMHLAVGKLSYEGGDAKNGLAVELVNHGQLVMPVPLDVGFQDGGHSRVTVPVEAWMQGNVASFVLPTNKNVARVTLDPDHALPLSAREDSSGVVAAPGTAEQATSPGPGPR